MALSTRDWAGLFSALGIIGIFFILLSDVAGTGRSVADISCEYFRNQDQTHYNEILTDSKYSKFKEACCTYDTGNPACS